MGTIRGRARARSGCRRGLKPVPEIVLDSVTKAFESQRGSKTLALTNLNLRINSNEIACLVGPSGCGKTTLLNLIAGFEQPTTGAVLVGGRRVTRPAADRVVIFQDVRGSLMPWWTARQNVEFGLRMLRRGNKSERRELAREYLTLVGLEAAQDKYPEELSGGMQQRVQIARALVTNPSVLLMDEPFGALDFLTRSRLQTQLQELHAHTPKTIVFVTHDLGEAAILGDTIWVMDSGGRIVAKVEVSAPRPRSITAPAVVSALNRLMQLVMPEEAAIAEPSSPVPRKAAGQST
jgi:NitT/TauT family transport system ATP-binding protein